MKGWYGQREGGGGGVELSQIQAIINGQSKNL